MDRYMLNWVEGSEPNLFGIGQRKIKLTSWDGKTYVPAKYCEKCGHIIINLKDV